MQLHTLDDAVKRGRELAALFRDHDWLQVEFADALTKRGHYDYNAKRNEQALPYYLEAAEVYRTRVVANKQSPKNIYIT